MAFKKSAKATEINYEVVEEYGVLSENGKYVTRLRYVSWNGNEPKYDIRPWYEDADGNERCSKGITLTGEEVEALYEILKGIAEE